MPGVLIDTATLVDLVLYCQPTKGRIRTTASSAGAAVEAMIFYEETFVDGPSFAGLVEGSPTTRYLEFYCDDPATVAAQARDLVGLCRPIPMARGGVVATLERGVELLDDALAPIEDPEDLRAYELYDYLPYHLGEDSTAIECQVVGRPVSNLEELLDEFPEDLAPMLRRYCEILRDREHPTRAAWVLPMLRLVYYEALQAAHRLHFAPHATKATIRFGRPEETVRSKRFLDYCRSATREDHDRRLRDAFDTRSISIPIPHVAGPVLSRPVRWSELMGRIARLRATREAAQYRSAVAALLRALERPEAAAELEDLLGGVEAAARAWRGLLPEAPVERRVAISVPLFNHDGDRAAPRPMVLTHPLLPGC